MRRVKWEERALAFALAIGWLLLGAAVVAAVAVAISWIVWAT